MTETEKTIEQILQGILVVVVGVFIAAVSYVAGATKGYAKAEIAHEAQQAAQTAQPTEESEITSCPQIEIQTVTVEKVVERQVVETSELSAAIAYVFSGNDVHLFLRDASWQEDKATRLGIEIKPRNGELTSKIQRIFTPDEVPHLVFVEVVRDLQAIQNNHGK
jgi:hypothetical protein